MQTESKKIKRYQECSWYIKAWRYRYVLAVPFKWVWYMTFGRFIVTDDETGCDERVYGDVLWSLLRGDADGRMNYWWTTDEVKAKLRAKGYLKNGGDNAG